MSALRIDQLRSDADAIAAPAHAALKHVPRSELGSDFAHVVPLPLYAKVELREITGNDRHRDSAVMMSSLSPSAKCSWSGSPERFSNGRTATAGRRSSASN